MVNSRQVNITGSMYDRQRKPKSGTTRKRRASVSGITGSSGAKRIRGSGDYAMFSGKKKEYTPFGDTGQHIGRFFGAPGLGFAAGHFLGRILGSGDYTKGPAVQSNVLYNTREIPEFVNEQGFSNIVHHREFITDITTASAANTFKVQGYALNPGVTGTFPWLSKLAQNYEQYKIHGMVFMFKSTSADALNSTNTALGSVIMATDYNPATALYRSKAEMANSQFAQSAKPSCSQMHGIECATSQKPTSILYLRSGAVPTGQDPRWFDYGTFQIATEGFQGTSVKVGELWVSYLVEFLKPQVPYTPTGNLPSALLNRTGATTAAPLGTVSTRAVGSLPVTISGGPNVMTLGLLPANTTVLIAIYWNQTDGSTTNTPSIALTAGLSALNEWKNGTVEKVNPGSGGTGTQMAYMITANVTDSNTQGVITLGTSGTTFGATATSTIDIIVTVLDETVD